MARYGLRSGSITPSASLTSVVAAPSKPAAKKPTKKRTRAVPRNGDKKAVVSEARKRSEKTKAVRTKNAKEAKSDEIRPRISTHVYIGNLPHDINEDMLNKHFAGCGKIRRTILRISSGQVGPPNPKTATVVHNRKYATMEFFDSRPTENALKLDKTMLGGSKLVVSTVPGGLPEVADVARLQLKSVAEREQQARLIQRFGDLKPRTPKPLMRQDTVPDFTDARNDKVRFWGISFVKTLI